MERICSGPLPAQAFTKLQVIKVKGCDRMKFVFLHSIVKHLSELLEIEVSECKFITKIIAEKGQEDDDGENDKIEFPKMRSLILEHLPSLVNLSPDPSIKATENNNGFFSQLLNDTRLLDNKST
ncbi:hypothetical protein RIF29_30687 [Crotalaria pallida]|uniref:Disease resistance protein At4g27190-like leucine-rich repeats domain-containing protein n=1 Tax=Crotalaria pallida TaxID=3830 RepID=A0AAN9EGT4_CROPI